MFNLIDEIIIQHLGFIFTFLALSVKDMLRLRVILAIAQILAGVYQVMIGRYDVVIWNGVCLLYTSPSPRDVEESRMPSSA